MLPLLCNEGRGGMSAEELSTRTGLDPDLTSLYNSISSPASYTYRE